MSQIFLNVLCLLFEVVAAQPDTTPIMSVEHGILEGQNVTFTCFGDVGNPPGTFIWEKMKLVGFFPTTYPDETTIIREIPGGCSYNGTSNLTITMEDVDDNAIVRCKVIQELLSSDVYQQTAPISVFCKYMLCSLETESKNANIRIKPGLFGKVTVFYM